MPKISTVIFCWGFLFLGLLLRNPGLKLLKEVLSVSAFFDEYLLAVSVAVKVLPLDFAITALNNGMLLLLAYVIRLQLF